MVLEHEVEKVYQLRQRDRGRRLAARESESSSGKAAAMTVHDGRSTAALRRSSTAVPGEARGYRTAQLMSAQLDCGHPGCATTTLRKQVQRCTYHLDYVRRLCFRLTPQRGHGSAFHTASSIQQMLTPHGRPITDPADSH
jgi:hypothetical protein